MIPNLKNTFHLCHYFPMEPDIQIFKYMKKETTEED